MDLTVSKPRMPTASTGSLILRGRPKQAELVTWSSLVIMARSLAMIAPTSAVVVCGDLSALMTSR